MILSHSSLLLANKTRLPIFFLFVRNVRDECLICVVGLQGVSLLYGEDEVADFSLDSTSARAGSIGGSSADHDNQVRTVTVWNLS